MAFEAKANSGNKPGWVKYVNPVFYGKGIGKFFIRRGIEKEFLRQVA